MCCDFINSFADCVPYEKNTNKMFKKTNEIIDVKMDTVTNNSLTAKQSMQRASFLNTK